MNDNIPVSTQWLLDAVGDTGRNCVASVFMIICPKTSSKGTGFLTDRGYIITNAHVIRGSSANEIVAISSDGKKVTFQALVFDLQADLAALTPIQKLIGGLKIFTDKIEIGTKVNTWGHPLGYNGPAPILSVGYVAGFRENQNGQGYKTIKHIVINGAFNSGNSGGALFKAGSEEVIGVVVAKHAPFPDSVMSGLQALSNNQSGLQFQATDSQGKNISVSESQIVAMFLDHLRTLAQVNIGEAISAIDLTEFLTTNKLV